MKLVTFYGSLDGRSREVVTPTVARLIGRFSTAGIETRYVVIGTAYGHIHTANGDIRTWRSYSGARKAVRNYKPGV